jgi:hypothetical protein
MHTTYVTCDFSTIAFDLTKAEKKPAEVYQGLPSFRLTAMSYLILPALPMVIRLSRVSSLQCWCRCVFSKDPLSFRSTSRHLAKIERSHGGLPRFASVPAHCHVLSYLTCTPHGYMAFACEFTAMLVPLHFFQGSTLFQINVTSPS